MSRGELRIDFDRLLGAGDGLVQLALPLLIYETTNSAFQLAGAYIVQFLPWLLFGLVGGVLVELVQVPAT